MQHPGVQDWQQLASWCRQLVHRRHFQSLRPVRWQSRPETIGHIFIDSDTVSIRSLTTQGSMATVQRLSDPYDL